MHRFVVAQLGARMHYAVPRILQSAGRLERLYTDFSAQAGWPTWLKGIPASLRPPAVQRLLGRVAKGVPADRITAFNFLGLRYARQLRRSHTPTEHTRAFLWSGQELCRRVLARGLGAASAVYTFNSAGLEILQAARRAGLLAAMEQTIAPKRAEMALLGEERSRFAEWEPDGGEDALAAELGQREAAEWNEAHLILCASDFVRDGIARSGGPAEKCVVVPYGVDGPDPAEAGDRPGTPGRERKPGEALRVLTVGAVGLRKGSPYVLEAAQRMRGAATFRMVGPLGVPPEVEQRLREQLDLTGPVPRAAIHDHFAWADVFLLPSICEGSATVTYEALAHGLPVVCTPNTGSVVRDSIDGFIIAARDTGALIDRLESLRTRPELRATLAGHARARAAEFTVAAYGRRLLAALG